MTMRSVYGIIFAVVMWAMPAAAQMEICNKTPAPFSVAIALETGSDMASQGWWTIDPDKCETVIEGELDKQYYYHYVISRALNVEWAGNYNFCTSNDPSFRINGSSECEQRGYRTTGYRQVDVEGNKAYTLTISMGPQPAAAEPPAAQPVVAAAGAAKSDAEMKNDPLYLKFKPLGQKIKGIIEATDGNTPEGSEKSMMYLSIQMNMMELLGQYQKGTVSSAQAEPLIDKMTSLMADGAVTKEEATPWIAELKKVTEPGK